MEIKKQILKICMEKGFLLDKEILDSLSQLDENVATKIIEVISNLKIKERVITKSTFSTYAENIRRVFSGGENKKYIERFFIGLGYSLTEVSEISEDNYSNSSEERTRGIKILSSTLIQPKKLTLQDFINHFRSRYEQLKGILQERNLENLKSLRRIGLERDVQNIIVIISGKRVTKNKNLVFDVEDLTGKSRVLVSANKKELYEKAKNILLDEVVAFNVSGSNEMLFANDVTFPEAILPEKRRAKEDIIVAFSSDVHVGSKMFLEENFLKFIKWINGQEGTDEQRAIAKKIKYLFLVGDNIDGVGVFPDQEKLLAISDVTSQYKKFVEFLKLIRKDIRIIICPGQHDAVWVGEPQPSIGENWAPELYKMENVSLVTNPCLLEIEEGFKILMYHGASMHGIIEEIPEIRLNFGHKSPTTVVKELLKRRHLSPIHGSCDYVPLDKDPMVLNEIPDIVVTGDLHRPEISIYNNILLVSSSCWQSITPFEEKVGNVPDPCKVPLLNLKTREIKIMDFSEKEKKENETLVEVKNGSN